MNQDDLQNQSLDMTEQWNYCVRLLTGRKWTILTFLSVTVCVVLVGTALQTPLYSTAATVLIDTEAASVLTVSTSRDDSTVRQPNYLTYADYYRTQLEIITSRRIANLVFNKLNLGEQLRYAGELDPIGALLEQVEVEPIKQTRLVKIHVEDSNPEQAARIANEFAFIFVRENLKKAAKTESMNLMKNEYLKLKSKEAELSKRYKEKFPAMVRVRERMKDLAKTIEENAYNQILNDQGQDLMNPESEQSLLERIQKGSMLGGLRPNNIKVQDTAQVPVKRSKPNASLNFLLGLLLGIIGGIGAAVVEEKLDGTVKTTQDVEQDGRFVLLGHIPRINKHISLKSVSKMNLKEHYQHVHVQSHTPASEAYRLVRTNLIYTAPQANSRAIVVTSPGSGEGKTTTVTNLAIALTQNGIKTLLVDADLRKPRLHKIFKIQQTPGLSDFLVGRATQEEISTETDIPGLTVITSGTCPPNPAELLGLQQMQDFLKRATSKYDQVLIDAPPIIPVTDAVILAALTKAVVAIAHSGKTPRQALHRLAVLCGDVKAKVLGVILNNVVDAGVPAYGYATQIYSYGETHSGKYAGSGFSLDFLSGFLGRAQQVPKLVGRFISNSSRRGREEEREDKLPVSSTKRNGSHK
jgi:polysaccharide biosynthesis transport protein